MLGGGESNEREVSLRSADSVAAALEESEYRVVRADPSDKDFKLEQLVATIDVVFPILHGVGGEDGSLQSRLEALGIPFLGSGSEAARLTFNKVLCKERLAEHGILTPNWEIVDRQTFARSDLARSSYVLKPISGGSSIDALVVHNPQHQQAMQTDFDKIFGRYGDMLLEELIEGQEITVAILADQPLPTILIVPPAGGEFDYNNKYNGKSQEIPRPDSIPNRLQEIAQRLAVDIHKLTDCRHLSRTDMIIAQNGAIYALEINTMPGLTKQSLFPKAVSAAGMTMTELVDRLVTMVLK